MVKTNPFGKRLDRLRESKLRQIFRPWLWCAAVLAAFAGFVPVAVFGSALAELLYVFLFLPMGLALVLIGGLILAQKHALSTLVAAVVFSAVTLVLFKNTALVQNMVRWPLYGKAYQRRVLAEPQPAGQMKHVVWNAWGFPGAGNTTVYLVYDPGNTLAEAARTHASGRFAGIPCRVPLVRRLASQWYAVEYYTDETWNRCDAKAVEPKQTP